MLLRQVVAANPMVVVVGAVGAVGAVAFAFARNVRVAV